MRWRAAIVVLALAACGRPAAPPERGQVRASITRSGGSVVVRAIPVSGTRINALLPPVLELSSGRAERLGSPHLTGDSAYFLAPPEVTVPGNTPLAGAIIRVSICDSGAAVCRVVTIAL